ncbi:MAG: ABC transporter permease subunit [Lachnospiraceae bacterium]|nr:ABC transporter permease subunit [Lachnospiraceae bacterium]
MLSKKKINQIKRNRIIYLMLLPGAVLTAIFSYTPLFGWWMAFTNYKIGKPIFGAEFVGLDNFKEFFGDIKEAIGLLKNTLAMNLLTLLIGMLIAMFFAILINEVTNKKVKKVIQTTSFFPFFISWVIVYNIFNTFLASESGLINVFLKNVGLVEEGINVLGDSKYSWGLIVASNIWKTLGYNSVLFLSAITGIDAELYNAADVDGADRIQKIMYITVPSLLPTLQVLLILNVGWIFGSNFDQFYLFTNTMNKEKMMVFDMYIYNMGMKNLRYSYATAVGIVKSVASIVTILVVNGVSKKLTKKGLF